MGGSRAHLLEQIDASLGRLQTDYVDLYQTHYADLDTPFAETVRTLDDIRRSGKARYLGCSNIRGAELVAAMWAAEREGVDGYVSLQPHYSLIHRDEVERELAWVCERYGLAILPFSPLEYGFLTGKYTREATPESARARQVTGRVYSERNWAILDALLAVSREVEASPAATAIAWLMAQPGVTAPILGARTVEQLQDNLAAASVTLSAEQNARLRAASAWEDSATRPPSSPKTRAPGG
jgi:aryl-alcohol dehydrogenase-like predicted oxidoreductase